MSCMRRMLFAYKLLASATCITCKVAVWSMNIISSQSHPNRQLLVACCQLSQAALPFETLMMVGLCDLAYPAPSQLQVCQTVCLDSHGDSWLTMCLLQCHLLEVPVLHRSQLGCPYACQTDLHMVQSMLSHYMCMLAYHRCYRHRE